MLVVNVNGQTLYAFDMSGAFYWLDGRDNTVRKSIPDDQGLQKMFALGLKGISDDLAKNQQVTQQLMAKYEYITKIVVEKLENGTLSVN